MKVKKFLLFLLPALLSGTAMAQRLDITLTDNSTVSFDVNKIQFMEVMSEGAPGHISGHWYLGYRTMSGNTVHYDGTEKLTFNGDVLIWEKTNTTDTYDLNYAENNKSFKAIKRGMTVGSTYNIITYENELLVLKTGSIVRYFYKSPEAAHNAEMEPFPIQRAEITDSARVLRQFKSGSSYSSVTPMGRHFENRHVTTDEDRAWLADPNNQPNTVIGDFAYWKAKPVTLYPFNEPSPADINQHAIGDCCFCAVLASFAYIYPDFIKHIITQDGNNFSVAMYDPQGKPVTVVVDNKFLCNAGGGLAQMTSKNNKVCWTTVLEKALMKWQTIYQCNGIEGIGTEHAAPPFTGCGNSFAISPGVLYNDELQLVAEWSLEQGMIGVGGFNQGDLLCGTLTTVTGHAFTLMYTKDPENYRFSMRNPWGITSVDGVLEIPNQRNILKTIDFRLVYPGAAAPFKKENLGYYQVPAFRSLPTDMGVSKRLLRMVGLESYGPEREVTTEE